MPLESPPSITEPTLLDEATSELIRGKARQLVHRRGFSSSDLPDLEQEIAAQVLARLGRFDPTKADRARFVRMLLAHAVGSVLRDRTRYRRRAPPALSAVLRTGQATEPIDPTAPTAEELDLALDVAAVLAALPPKLRRVAQTLKAHSVSAAARRLKMSRSAVNRRLVHLRAAFVAAGLEDFCSRARTVDSRRG